MNITNISDFLLFLIIFLPGFISLKIYDLLVPSAPRDFSKSFFEVIAYSALNYGFFSWLILWRSSTASPFISRFLIGYKRTLMYPISDKL